MSTEFGFDLERRYGTAPVAVAPFDEVNLPEMMHYLYLPVVMAEERSVRLPNNIECLRGMVNAAMRATVRPYDYAYVTARKGFATPDNPLNRPGWHCDGFGTDDMNFTWWTGPGTRFAVQSFVDISDDHIVSMRQFEGQVNLAKISNPREKTLYALDPMCVHATPLVPPPGCMRQFVKISLSNHRYNLADNSHNYLFDYAWPMVDRSLLRNDPAQAQAEYVIAET